ncbi:MAG: M81 family metallopeptidase [Hyphomicrobiaceae bacterium]|nr:M81 family metallopeptidase [Hyphomicrobiaceae bacterium]
MKIFMATLATETNSFSPIPTGHAAFREREFFRGDGSRHPPRLGNIPLIEWRRLGEADGHTIVESIATFAQPAGLTLKSVYEDLRDTLIADLEAAMPVDVVLLFMHGAMIAHGYDDCEGDTIAHVRRVVGASAKIGVELDLHCHLTEEMRTNSDVMVIFKEYPHTDVAERARELYPLTVAAAKGDVRPVMAYHDCRMISLWRTPEEPMRSFVRRMQDLEGRDGILSVSFGHGFPWGDVADVGAKVLVVADADMAKAERLAAELGREIWDMRERTATAYDSIDAAIDRASATSAGKPIVLADVADNAGAGAASDSTSVLRRLVERRVRDVATGLYWDPIAAQLCNEAGLGATFDLRIGGKMGPASGDPVDLRVTVRGLSADHRQQGLSGGRERLGPSAWVEADGIHIILVSTRQQTFSPEGFTGLGCRLDDKKLVVVKSMQHFYAAFAPIAAEVRYVSAHGAVGPDFAAIPYSKLATPYWPRVADPFTGRNTR